MGFLVTNPMMSSQDVEIHLENGAIISGQGWGDFSRPRGAEFVFCTAMTGIEESLTDPSFAGQVLVNTPAHVGNTGYTTEDRESSKIWAEGLVCRHLEMLPTQWRARQSIAAWIVEQERFAVTQVDTRALTILLREEGSQRGVVVPRGSRSAEQVQQWMREHVPSMVGRQLVDEVSCARSFLFEEEAPHYWPLAQSLERSENPADFVPEIAVWDFGVKTNTLRILSKLGARVRVMPAKSSAEDILAAGRHGILLSNGPGDPEAATHVLAELKKVVGRRPLFAICLGHQLMALAAGLKTYKMKFGHRGIHHPVVQVNPEGRAVKTWITSQNHGFAVDAQNLPSQVHVSFQHADDASVEGLSFSEWQCESVQFHPEAAPGPYEGVSLLKDFMAEVVARGRE